MTEKTNRVSWIHRFASLLAVMTFLLILFGTLASGSVGMTAIVPWSAQGGGLPARYVHIDQFLAVTVAFMSLTLAFGLWKTHADRYIKNLASIAIGVLLWEAFVAWGPIRTVLPVGGVFVYACGIQVFFCLTVCLALFTRSDWRWDHPKARDLRSPSVRQVLIFMTAATFLQPLLGEGFEQKLLGIAPHFVVGVVVTLCALWIFEMAITKFLRLTPFKIAAIFLAELVGLQLFLGIVSYSMNLNARIASNAQPGLVVMNVTHAAVGVLVVAASLFTTFQAFKYLATAESAAPPVGLPEEQKADPQFD